MTYVAKQGFSQVLQMRGEYHYRLDMNKTGETPYQLSGPTCNLLWIILRIKISRKGHIRWIQLFFGNEWHLLHKHICIRFVFSLCAT